MTYGHITDNGMQGRFKYGPGFTAARFGNDKLEICHDGRLVVVVHDLNTLPDGFTDRLARHVMDLCTGKRSVLWDEQAVYGPNPVDPERVRHNAERQAARNLGNTEAGITRGDHLPPAVRGK